MTIREARDRVRRAHGELREVEEALKAQSRRPMTLGDVEAGELAGLELPFGAYSYVARARTASCTADHELHKLDPGGPPKLKRRAPRRRRKKS